MVGVRHPNFLNSNQIRKIEMSIMTSPVPDRPENSELLCDALIDGKTTELIINKSLLNIIEIGHLIEIESVEYVIESIKYKSYLKATIGKNESTIDRLKMCLQCGKA